MLYKGDLGVITILQNVKAHMDMDYDFLLPIVGDTGAGKSRFALNLMETWYRVILKQPVTADMISHVSQDYGSWLKNFQNIKPYDINIYDECSRDLSSRDFMTRMSKDLNKLFDVCRSKRFFSIVILPNFFRLNKALREDRLRGLIWIPKRGSYKLYSKEGIKYLNGYNANRKIKSMHLARPFHSSCFPDYKGVMLENYIKQKDEGVDEVLAEVIGNLEPKINSRTTIAEIMKPKVQKLIKQGKNYKEIAKELNVSNGTVTRAVTLIHSDIAQA